MAEKIMVIGGGIIGAATAYHLSRKGAAVTVLDAAHGGATAATFGWVNASYFANLDHFHLRVAGMQAWDRLARDLDLPFVAKGSITWDQPAAALHDMAKDLADLGYPVQVLGNADFRTLEPAVADVPEISLLFPSERVVDANTATAKLLSLSGALVLTGVTVDQIDANNSGVRLNTTLGELKADQIVVAAGAATESLLAPFGTQTPLRPSPTIVLKTNPARRVCRHVLGSPVGDIRQMSDGAFMMPTDLNHQGTDADIRDVSVSAVIDDALPRLQSLFPDLGLQAAGLTMAWRPMPQDGLPIVGAVSDRVYCAVMHSGVTLGALMGELIADEVLQGPTNRSQSHLSPYRPERFVSQ